MEIHCSDGCGASSCPSSMADRWTFAVLLRGDTENGADGPTTRADGVDGARVDRSAGESIN